MINVNFEEKANRVFLRWIVERESIRMKKAKDLPKPWTDDEIFQSYRFCNVRRMDDKVSRWLLDKWYHPDAESRTLLIAATLARCLNWPPTLRYLSSMPRQHMKINPDRLKLALVKRQAAGKKVFSAAYIFSSCTAPSKIDHAVSVAKRVADAADSGGVIVPGRMRDTWANLMRIDGIGSFIAGQIVADLRWTAAMHDPVDRMAWAPLGPGSRRGMRRLLGQVAEGPLAQSEFDILLPTLLRHVQARLPNLFADRRLEAMDIQNCLCEFDKYMRTLNGEGRPRNRYDGSGGM